MQTSSTIFTSTLSGLCSDFTHTHTHTHTQKQTNKHFLTSLGALSSTKDDTAAYLPQKIRRMGSEVLLDIIIMWKY